MKILVIGDFHGKFLSKLNNLTKKVDLVVSLGDYPSWSLKKEFFQYCYKKKDVQLWEKVGKKRYKEESIKDLKKGKEIIEKLNKFPVPVFSVLGNYDHPSDDVHDLKKKKGKKFWKWDEDKAYYFSKLIKNYQNIRRIDYQSFEFKGIVFIGARGHSYPGKVKSKAYKKYKKILDKLFNKNKNKKIIFVTHIGPYETKLDKITDKNAHKIAKGKHYGSKMFKRLITKWQPLLNLSGHFHENQGKDKIRKTVIVNSGAIEQNKFAIVDIDEEKGKVKSVKFFG